MHNSFYFKMRYLFFFIGFIFSSTCLGQNSSQTIKGYVFDAQSHEMLIGVQVRIIGSNPTKGAISDVDGKYMISDVLPGRYDLLFTYETYNDVLIPNVLVTVGKEVVLDVPLEEKIEKMEEVVITSKKKDETNNDMITVSGRSLSMEEVNRFAGGRADPSRMAANFAGVSTPDDTRNDIVIRGNSPSGVLWRVEGLNIPNPNHFSTIGTTGGPVSGLNTNMLKNSDFFTSAFPAEYGNANAGVFDIGFRKGNSDKREHTLQFGLLTGLEGMTEGPINKEKGSSYLIAYRYSFTGVAHKLGLPIGTVATPFYQDISFKFNSGTTKYGKFIFFGMGGTSNIDFKHDEIDSLDLFANPKSDSYFKSKLGLIGVNHFIRAGKNAYFKTVIGSTYSNSDYNEDSVNTVTKETTRIIENRTSQLRYLINTSYNYKKSARTFFKFGLIEELINLDLFWRNRVYTPDWIYRWDFNDYTSLIQLYGHMKYSSNERNVFNIGLHTQFLTLNNSYSLEPRAGWKHTLNEKSSFGLGYGLHSQMQPTDVYFFRSQLPNGDYVQSNKNLDFTRSHHFVLEYNLRPIKDWRIKSEVYYQYLFNVPVEVKNSSYSMLNVGSSFYPNDHDSLVNEGTGMNYGFELTIEKFFSKGYYALFTGSIYESKYKGSDGVIHNTAFNGQFVYNILMGKEFKIGKEKRHRFTLDVKMTHAGGRFYTPIDLDASLAIDWQVEKGDEFAFTLKNPDFFRVDFKTGFTFNSKTRKLSHVVFLDIQNITNNKNVFAVRYNPMTNSINTAYQIGFFPNFGYKVQF
jgi:hypothetical protein